MSRVLLPIDLRLIDVVDRLREVDKSEFSRVLTSFREVGQLTPIEVVRRPEGRFKLVAGGHRVQAAKELGWETIDSVVFEGTEDEAMLREIDENLARVELSAFDQANFIAKRRVIWEKIHGQIKRGGDRRSKDTQEPLIGEMKKPGFIKATAAALGYDPSTIKRALSRKAQIMPDVWEALKGTKDAKNGALLDKLRKEPVERQAEVLRVSKERGTSIGNSLSILREREQVKLASVVQMMAKVKTAWAGWTAEERAVFRKEVAKLK